MRLPADACGRVIAAVEAAAAPHTPDDAADERWELWGEFVAVLQDRAAKVCWAGADCGPSGPLLGVSLLCPALRQEYPLMLEACPLLLFSQAKAKPAIKKGPAGAGAGATPGSGGRKPAPRKISFAPAAGGRVLGESIEESEGEERVPEREEIEDAEEDEPAVVPSALTTRRARGRASRTSQQRLRQARPTPPPPEAEGEGAEQEEGTGLDVMPTEEQLPAPHGRPAAPGRQQQQQKAGRRRSSRMQPIFSSLPEEEAGEGEQQEVRSALAVAAVAAVSWCDCVLYS